MKRDKDCMKIFSYVIILKWPKIDSYTTFLYLVHLGETLIFLSDFRKSLQDTEVTTD
jgi:hypothetical protein